MHNTKKTCLLTTLAVAARGCEISENIEYIGNVLRHFTTDSREECADTAFWERGCFSWTLIDGKCTLMGLPDTAESNNAAVSGTPCAGPTQQPTFEGTRQTKDTDCPAGALVWYDGNLDKSELEKLFPIEARPSNFKEISTPHDSSCGESFNGMGDTLRCSSVHKDCYTSPVTDGYGSCQDRPLKLLGVMGEYFMGGLSPGRKDDLCAGPYEKIYWKQCEGDLVCLPAEKGASWSNEFFTGPYKICQEVCYPTEDEEERRRQTDVMTSIESGWSETGNFYRRPQTEMIASLGHQIMS